MTRKSAQELISAAGAPLDADAFARYLGEVGAAIQADLRDLFARTAWELYRRVVEKTPVDTGRTRANWQLAEQTNDRLIEGPGGGPDWRELSSAERLWLFNNLPHAQRLESGDSGRAGSGVLALSVEEVRDWLELELKQMGYL